MEIVVSLSNKITKIAFKQKFVSFFKDFNRLKFISDIYGVNWIIAWTKAYWIIMELHNYLKFTRSSKKQTVHWNYDRSTLNFDRSNDNEDINAVIRAIKTTT